MWVLSQQLLEQKLEIFITKCSLNIFLGCSHAKTKLSAELRYLYFSIFSVLVPVLFIPCWLTVELISEIADILTGFLVAKEINLS